MVDRISRRLFLGGLGSLVIPVAGLAEAPARSLRPQLRGAELSGVERVIQAAGLKGEVVFAVAEHQMVASPGLNNHIVHDFVSASFLVLLST